MSASRPSRDPQRPALLAGIDLGSNSFRLELAQLAAGHYRRVDYLKETVRLGGGLDAEGLLGETAMQRALECLARFSARLADMPPTHVRAVATQTLREARNRDAFLQRAQASLGYPIEVISGREEARLIFAGVARLQPSDKTRLVIDIGGRSTEMIIGKGHTPRVAESFQVGSVGLSQRFFPDGRLTAPAFRAAQIAAGAELEEAMATYTPSRWREVLGSSGTVGAVSQILAASGRSDGTITVKGLQWCIEQCLAAGHQDQLDLPGLKPDRRAVAAGGLCILYTLLTQFRIPAIVPARGALRQGVIFELGERLGLDSTGRRHDLRDASVRALQQRFHVDVEQARRVRQVALSIFDQLGPKAADDRRELGWAADLHEVGMSVSHHDHHRHSAYLLGHVDVAGFSQSEQRRLATLALAQRGGLRKIQDALSDAGLLRQVLSLRVAILLCHARVDIGKLGALATPRGERVRLQLSPAWSKAHPRTLYLLAEEAAAWNRSGVPLALDLA